MAETVLDPSMLEACVRETYLMLQHQG